MSTTRAPRPVKSSIVGRAARMVGDGAVRDGNVEVHADEHALAAHLCVRDASFTRHGTPHSLFVGRRARRRAVRSPGGPKRPAPVYPTERAGRRGSRRAAGSSTPTGNR